MDELGFPKYQISKFHGQGRELQSVFRTNDEKEYKAQLKEWLEVSKITPITPTSTPQSTATPPSTMESKVCEIHGVAMYQKEGKFGPYFSHYDKEQGYCNGRGFKAKTYKQY